MIVMIVVVADIEYTKLDERGAGWAYIVGKESETIILQKNLGTASLSDTNIVQKN